MEAKLFRLFDFQDFERNAALQNVIDAVHARQSVRELELDDLEWVAAAGEPNQTPPAGDQDGRRRYD